MRNATMEGPCKLPEGWQWVRLGEVATVERQARKPTDLPPDLPYVGLEHVESNTGVVDITKCPSISSVSSQVYLYDESHILYSKLRPYLNKVYLPAEQGACTTELLPLKPDCSQADRHFLAWYLRSPTVVAYSNAHTTGSRQPRVDLRALMTLFIPLPPLFGQQRVVARIEELMTGIREARRLREEARRDTERLWQAVLAETFPRPGAELPEGWRWVRLGEVCLYERRTVDPRRSPQMTFYLYSIPAYDKGQRPESLPGSQIGSGKVVIEPGVCLFSKLNPRIPRSWMVAAVPQDGVPVASTEFMPLRPNSSVLDLGYLSKLLVTDGFISQVRPDVTGATGSRQRLKPEVVLSALIPLPPLSEQRRIVAHLEAVHGQIKGLKEAQAATDADLKRLEQAILEKAFRGEL